jgi:hypothetical protein
MVTRRTKHNFLSENDPELRAGKLRWELTTNQNGRLPAPKARLSCRESPQKVD